MDELLVKYLLGETTAAEEQSVLEWIAAHEDNKRHFLHFKTIWEESRALSVKSPVDADQAWERFKAIRAAGSGGNVISFEPARSKGRMRVTRMAAAVAVLVIGSFAAYFFLNKRGDIVLASADKVLTDTLPDGSVITLNKNSTLAYSNDFNKTNRKVTLTGEAFFHVTPDKQKPFEITVDEVQVKVVGTSFNVKNTAEETEVIVETGIVKVGLQRQSASVLPEQKAVVRKKEQALEVKSNHDDLYNYYRTRKFICRNTPLSELAMALNSAYDVNIVIPEKRIGDLRLTTIFKDMSLNEILNVVTLTFNLNIEQKNGKIILK